jgi:hypothetical protein
LSVCRLQLQPGNGSQGALGAGLPLQQLRLSCCTLLDGVAGLAAALALLPELHHLVLIRLISESGCYAGFPSSALISVPQLTYLDWVGGAWQDPGGLQHLQRLTRLQHLQLCTYDQHTVQASSLSGLQSLTCLKLHGVVYPSVIEPGALAGLTQLQHMELLRYSIAGGAAGVAQLLLQLEPLQQLTHLALLYTHSSQEQHPPAACFSAVTASSTLHDLDVGCCILPAGVWQHFFPAGRRLPHLTSFYVTAETYPQPHSEAVAPAGELLVRGELRVGGGPSRGDPEAVSFIWFVLFFCDDSQ